MSAAPLFGCVVAPSKTFGAELTRLSEDFTPRFELEESLALMDLSGLSHLFHDTQSLGAAIVGAAENYGITAPRLALTKRLQSARRLALFRPGLSIAIDDATEAAMLGALPIESLDLDDRVRARLHTWGLRTASDLASLPADELRSRGGVPLVRAHESSSGRDERLLLPIKQRADDALGFDPGFGIEDLNQLVFLLFRLIDPLCDKMQREGKAATVFETTLTLEDATVDVRFIRSPSPSADNKAWRTLTRLNLEGRPPQAPVLALSVRAETATAPTIQFSFTGAGRSSPEKVAGALARLQRFYPEARIGSPRLADTHVPDSFEVRPFDPVRTKARASVKVAAARAASLPRPPAAALRQIRPPAIAEVTVDGSGAPIFVRVKDDARFLNIRGKVQASGGPYLLSTQWWDEEAFAREEWDVELMAEQPGVYLLFRDARNSAWYLAGELD